MAVRLRTHSLSPFWCCRSISPTLGPLLSPKCGPPEMDFQSWKTSETKSYPFPCPSSPTEQMRRWGQMGLFESPEANLSPRSCQAASPVPLPPSPRVLQQPTGPQIGAHVVPKKSAWASTGRREEEKGVVAGGRELKGRSSLKTQPGHSPLPPPSPWRQGRR